MGAGRREVPALCRIQDELQYVDSVTTGAGVYGLYLFQVSDSTKTNSIKADLSATFSEGAAKADFSSSMSSFYSRHESDMISTFKAHTSGITVPVDQNTIVSIAGGLPTNADNEQSLPVISFTTNGYERTLGAEKALPPGFDIIKQNRENFVGQDIDAHSLQSMQRLLSTQGDALQHVINVYDRFNAAHANLSAWLDTVTSLREAIDRYKNVIVGNPSQLATAPSMPDSRLLRTVLVQFDFISTQIAGGNGGGPFGLDENIVRQNVTAGIRPRRITGTWGWYLNRFSVVYEGPDGQTFTIDAGGGSRNPDPSYNIDINGAVSQFTVYAGGHDHGYVNGFILTDQGGDQQGGDPTNGSPTKFEHHDGVVVAFKGQHGDFVDGMAPVMVVFADQASGM